ncbi:cupin domain-containing protein [Uniformispora flossi]|uniref:cupin domain-containing protein n=1 Tax=Uniformispora flossi TaxID=3390723 RepID=UPI003C2D50B4
MVDDSGAGSGAAETGGAFRVRRVVTGTEHGVAEDGIPAVTVASRSGHGLSELLWFEAPPRDAAQDGGDPPAGMRGAFPQAGAAVCRLIRFPGIPAGTPGDDTWLRVPGDDPAMPGMHRSETLDLMIVVDGEILLGLDAGEYALRPGDAVIQRGTRHRWRVLGESPCTFLSVLLSPEPDAPPAGAPTTASATPAPQDADTDTDNTGDPGTATPRLLITATDPEGRSYAASFGPPAPAFPPREIAMYDLWQTGGPLADVAQGGTDLRDADGHWQLSPIRDGVAMRRVEFAAGHDPGEAGWHTTATIDVGIVLSGSLALDLAAEKSTDPVVRSLRTGDVMVQRGTHHRWRPLDGEPAVLVSVMFALRDA